MYRPGSEQFATVVMLLVPEYSSYNGVNRKKYPDTGMVLRVNWKSYGGTEREVNGLTVIEDTATVTTWYDPAVRSDCIIKREDGALFEIINEPENIEMRNQYMTFKVRRYKGGL